MKYCFGVDVGGTSVKMGLFTQDGTLIEKREIQTRTENHGEAILPDIAGVILSVMDKHGIRKEDVRGVGAGIPAPVMEDGIVQMTANLGWGYKDVKKELEALTGISAGIGNDANVAALGEMWKGGGTGYKNLVMVTLGTGVGGGIIIDGHIVAGAGGAAGEIGHLCVNYEETEQCGCGLKGCLEQYASASGIVRLAKKKMELEGKTIEAKGENLTAKDIFDAVKRGDKAAMEVAEEFASYLGHALANISTVLNPELFVIGGGVSNAGEILLKYIGTYYHERAFWANRNVRFALAKLGNDAGIYGAAKLALEV